MKQQGELTHKEAVRKALEILGGKAQLKQIYPVAIKLIGKNTRSVDIKATIRRELNSSPFDFKATPGVEGSWELVNYQEEIARRDSRIAELETLLTAKDDEIAKLKNVPTEDDFVKKFVKETKHFFKHDRKKADTVRQIMIKVGRSDADKELDSWIEGKEQPSTAQALDRQTEALLKVVDRPTTQNIHGDIIHGDKVTEKTVIPNVANFQPQITTQNLEVPKPPLGLQQEQELLEDE